MGLLGSSFRTIYLLLKSWLTNEPRDWKAFARQIERTINPDRYSGLLILGLSLKAGARPAEAALVLERAVKLRPSAAFAWLVLGKSLKAAGNREPALQALARSYQLEPGRAVISELKRYGARCLLSAPEDSVYPIEDYAAFLEHHLVSPPPVAVSLPLRVMIESDDPLRATLTLKSLVTQSHQHWHVELCGDPELEVSQIDGLDGRVIGPQGSASLPEGCWVVNVKAGTVLDQYALAWFAWAIEHTGCQSVYCDHDHYGIGTEGQLQRKDPVLQPCFDRIWFASSDKVPAVLAIKVGGDHYERETSHALMLKAAQRGPVTHIPRILASIDRPYEFTATSAPAIMASTDRISVIIPTRDNPRMLAACLDTLRLKADAPERLDIVVVDNGSRDADALDLFQKLKDDPSIRIVTVDSPFNWSRLNNIAAEQASGDILLFLNDDMEMLSKHWDSVLEDALREDRAGLVGARMVYPNQTIQHAGFVFGMDNGPQHEGRWMPSVRKGPGGRWVDRHQSVAVTGAFMAMSGSLYRQLKGFDDRNYAVDFSDVDMCLRVREAGYLVIYEPKIKLLHHESVSRGHNRSHSKKRRARAEADALASRWGLALKTDPGYNPQWTQIGYPFDGYRDLPVSEIIEHITNGSQPNPWQVRRAQ